MIINNESYDPANLYNPATGVVTITETGLYRIDAKIEYDNASPGTYSLKLKSLTGTSPDIYLRISRQQVTSGIVELPLSISCELRLNAGITLRLFTSHDATTSRSIVGSFYTWFNVRKVD